MHTENKDRVRIKQETSRVQLKGSCEVKSNLLDTIGHFSFQNLEDINIYYLYHLHHSTPVRCCSSHSRSPNHSPVYVEYFSLTTVYIIFYGCLPSPWRLCVCVYSKFSEYHLTKVNTQLCALQVKPGNVSPNSHSLCFFSFHDAQFPTHHLYGHSQ